MLVIDTRTVELTPDEEIVKEWFEAHLDTGFSVPFSAKLALNRMLVDPAITTRVGTGAFVGWLSDDTVERRGSRYRIKPSCR